jgi:hypothetical protein
MLAQLYTCRRVARPYLVMCVADGACVQFHGIRNDKNGARSDCIFTADATEYAAQLRKLQQHRHQQGLPAEGAQPPPLPPQHQQQQQQQQQQQPQQTVVQEAFSICLTSALSSAFIFRVSTGYGTLSARLLQ